MRFVVLVAAFAVVALLMSVGMHQRWIPGPRGRWEPGARGRWEPGLDIPAPHPRGSWWLAAIGWGLLLSGMLLSLLLANQAIALIAFVLYAATWIGRIILLDWLDWATGPILRAVAIVRPLALVSGVALTAMTKSVWWLIVGGVLFIVIPLATDLIRRNRARELTNSRATDEAPPE